MRFFRFLQFDFLSFLTGLIAGILGAWLGSRLRRRYSLPLRPGKAEYLTSQGKGPAGLELRLRNEVLRHAQTLHLAAPLFSLDEILLPPYLLLPPTPFDPEETPSDRDFDARLIPDLPDWPELASAFGSPQVGLAEALEGRAGLLLTGEPGMGKTVTLAHLASQLARRETKSQVLSGVVPLLVHAADLALQVPGGDEAPVEPNAVPTLAAAVAPYAPSIPLPRLVSLLEQLLRENRALLILDDLDELPPREYQPACAFLKGLLEAYPSLQVVAAAAPDYYPGLVELGLIPVSLAPWEGHQRRALIQKWGELWRSAESVSETQPAVDPAILDGWLLQDASPLTPLELTLKLWAAHAGDALGSQPSDALEAYVRRMTAGDRQERSKLESLAEDFVLAESIAAIRSPEVGTPEAAGEGAVSLDPHAIGEKKPAHPGSAAFESGILRQHDGRARFAHPAIAAYLAAAGHSTPEAVLSQSGSWAAKAAFLRFSSRGQSSAWVQGYLERSSPPLQKYLITAARWLASAPAAPWETAALRWLAMLVQNESAPTGLRCRALAGLALSGSGGLTLLFQGFVKSPDDTLRLLGVLGAGFLRDPKLFDDLTSRLQDPALPVRRAAALALVKLGSGKALDAVAEMLLHSDEFSRRAAAEALAADPVEGHSLLKEGSELQDLLVRRAVVYGLRRVRQPWAMDLLWKLQLDDPEWVVKNTATQALEDVTQDARRIPRPAPALSETPWLIAFAGRLGIGIAPGRPAENLLLRALQEGNPVDQLAALETLRLHPNPVAIGPVGALLESEAEELRAAAFETLWRLSAQGCEV